MGIQYNITGQSYFQYLLTKMLGDYSIAQNVIYAWVSAAARYPGL